jgi:hypothetical protein
MRRIYLYIFGEVIDMRPALACQTKVNYFNGAILCQHHVRGLEVAMDDLVACIIDSA